MHPTVLSDLCTLQLIRSTNHWSCLGRPTIFVVRAFGDIYTQFISYTSSSAVYNLRSTLMQQ